MGPKRAVCHNDTEKGVGRSAQSSERSRATQSSTALAGQRRTLHGSSPGRTEATEGTGVGRPKRSAVPAHFNLEPEATGMSWAEEADLKRALYASIQGKRHSKARNPRWVVDSESEADDSSDDSSGSNGASTVSRESRYTRKKCGSPVAKRAHRKFAQPGASPDSEHQQPCTSRQAARRALPTRGSPVASAPVQVFTREGGAPIYTEDLMTYLCYHRSTVVRGDFGSMAPFVNHPTGQGKVSTSEARQPCLSSEKDGHHVQVVRPYSAVAAAGDYRSSALESTAAIDRTRERPGERLRNMPALPLATASDLDDPLGCYVYMTIARPVNLSDRLTVHHSYHIDMPRVVDYVQDELSYRAALRAAAIPSEELRRRRGRRSAAAALVASIPPYVCSVTGYHSHVSVVCARGNLLSTRYAALLGSALAEDPTARLYTLISDDLLKSLCSVEGQPGARP